MQTGGAAYNFYWDIPNPSSLSFSVSFDETGKKNIFLFAMKNKK